MPDEWYRNFAEGLETQMMFELTQAANYTMIQPLADLMALQTTFCIMGKSAEEVSSVCSLVVDRREFDDGSPMCLALLFCRPVCSI